MVAEKMTGIEELRLTVNVCSWMKESFNDRYSAAQLVAICIAHSKCEWDYLPDTWTTRQVKEAIKGIVPRWDEEGEKPVYK